MCLVMLRWILWLKCRFRLRMWYRTRRKSLGVHTEAKIGVSSVAMVVIWSYVLVALEVRHGLWKSLVRILTQFIVFHTDCSELTAAQLQRGYTVCPQHQCSTCHCNTSEAGGMLFK